MRIDNLKKIFLRSTIICFFLKIFYSCKYNIDIIKKKNLYIHNIKKYYFINFHPVRNISSFFDAYKLFTDKYKPKKGDVILDVGTGIGSEMLLFSRAVGSKGKVVCIEPDLRLIEVLKQVIKINNLKNVKLYKNFFYNKNNKKIGFSFNSISDWMSNSQYGKNKSLVKSITLNKIVKDNKISKINFAKFNIEGSEKYLNNGNNNFLKICKNIVISCHDFLEKEETNTHTKILKILKKNYFKILKKNSDDIIIKYFVYGKK
jgi:FkbM family methyltransferase